MDVLVNNVVNAETSGYKSGQLLSRSFSEMLINRINDPAVLAYNQQVGPLGPGIHIDEIYTDFTQGPLEATDRPQDLALAGDGFFVIQTPDGERYSRDGSFLISPAGYLTTSDGWPVLGQNGRIYVNDSFLVSEHGLISQDGAYVDRLRLVSFTDPGQLRKEGNNLYLNYGGSALQEAGDTLVKQGYLENSNLDLAQTMVDMIKISRMHEINQRVIRMIDGTLDKAVNEVGRVR